MWRGRQQHCPFVYSVARLITFLPHHVCSPPKGLRGWDSSVMTMNMKIFRLILSICDRLLFLKQVPGSSIIIHLYEYCMRLFSLNSVFCYGLLFTSNLLNILIFTIFLLYIVWTKNYQSRTDLLSEYRILPMTIFKKFLKSVVVQLFFFYLRAVHARF